MFFSLAATRFTVGMLALFVLLSGCKPSDEADRTNPRVFANSGEQSSDTIQDLDAWLHASTPNEAKTSNDETSANNSFATSGSRAAVDRMKATKHFEQGLTHAKAGAQDKEIIAYEAAIDSDPTWARPRFELAKLHAVLGAARKANDALKGLVSLASVSGDNFLRRARVTPEFKVLQKDATFRTATRFVPIEVSPARGTKNKKLIRDLVQGLRERLIPAHEGDTWKGKERATTVYYAKRNTSAEEAALEVVRSASLPPRVVSSKYLNSKRPVVLVLVESDTASAGSFLTDKRLEDFMGLPLEAKGASGERHSFSLDKTGFFSWKTVLKTGHSEEKTGRYHVSSNRLSFSFRLTKRTPSGKVQEQEQGRRSSSQLQLREQGLLLDSLEFRVVSTGRSK